MVLKKHVAGTLVKNLNRILLLYPDYKKENKLVIPHQEVYTGGSLEGAITSLRDNAGIITDPKSLNYLGQFETEKIIYDLYEMLVNKVYVKLDKENFYSHEWMKTRVFKHRTDLMPGLSEIIDQIYSKK
jgi:hypothetical protein